MSSYGANEVTEGRQWMINPKVVVMINKSDMMNRGEVSLNSI